MPSPSGDIKSDEAAALLGISRRTLYRWIDEGRVSYPIMRAGLRPVATRQRGPRRNPYSIRYTQGRHTFRPKQETPH
jgi:predicted DNA-binding transcriptional regulator YafY